MVADKIYVYTHRSRPQQRNVRPLHRAEET